jgi:hypothetical protein
MALNMALILTLGEQVVQAQSSQTAVNAETSSRLAQPSPSPDVTPSDVTPSDATPSDETAEPTESRQPRNFIGVGGSIGLSGEDIGLSESGFAIMNRKDLNDRLSIRGANVFGSTRNDNTIALTVNFPVRSSSGETQLIPFVGGGLLISSKGLFNDVLVRGLATGGIDVPLSRRFTATSAVNVGFTDPVAVGVGLGVMYGF